SQAITHLAKTREMGDHGRAAQQLRQVVESLKRTGQVEPARDGTLEETTLLKQCPTTLFLYLMRFEHVRSGGRFVERKLSHHVDVPKSIDMAPYTRPPASSAGDPQPQWYDLTGVVHHEGKTTKGGHYTAFVRLAGEEWRRYNDSKVTQVGCEDVLTENALILTYTRRSG
ncbi:unnamed protein product, partial [Ectocarpus sp. 12 AP-2014]